MSTAVAEKKQNGQAQPPQQLEERSISYIPIGEKESIQLTVSLVSKFLCVKTRSGKIASHEDIVKFMMLCKAQGLNPWVNDAYLVGYDSNDGPKFQLISAHQALLKRAELSAEYNGMESGVCVLQKDGSVHERQGDLVVKGETLVGGWARVYRRDRGVPSYDSLNLSTFSTGKSRWNADPSGMIVKCAEASALRKAFPSTLAQMYCREEMERNIEHGDRDASPRLESSAQAPPATKSAALVSILASRTEQREPEESHQDQSAQSQSDETETAEEQSQPSNFAKLAEWVGIQPGVTVNQDARESDTYGEWYLPNRKLLIVGETGSIPSSDEATDVVDCLDPGAFEQLKNVVERASKVRK